MADCDYLAPDAEHVDLDLQGDYNPPIYNQVNLSFECIDSFKRHWSDYYPPNFNSVDFELSGDYIAPENEVDINLEPVEPPEPEDCEPDWEIIAGNFLDFKNCDDGDPDWVLSDPQNLVIDFTCCGPEPTEEYIVYGAPVLSIFLEGEAEFLERIDVSGLTKPLEIILDGNAIYEDKPTVWGDITLPIILEGQLDRGAVINGTPTIQGLSASGEAVHYPEYWTVNGNLQLPITANGTAEAFVYIDVSGDIPLTISANGQGIVCVFVEGIQNPLDISLTGTAEMTIVTVQPSTLVLDNVILEGDANYNLVPTLNGDITLSISMQGDAAYIDTPTAWGDISLEITVSNESAPIEVGTFIYWANLSLDISASGYAETPIVVEDTNIVIGDLKFDSEIQVTVVGSTSQIHIGELRFNRGWIEYGTPTPPMAREIYELSNNRKVIIPEYPLDAKYAIYVPTTDYTIHNVELRRGTVEYTLEFNFDALQVEKIIVWLVDENGNSVKDSIAKYVGGPTTPHELERPFKYVYALTIPVHCVNNKKYEFYLEVVYTDEKNNGVVVFPRQSFLVPFQAHFDNRNPYANATDRTSVVDAYFPSTEGSMLSTETVSFDPITCFNEDNVYGIHLSGADQLQTFDRTYFELTQIDYSVIDTGTVHLMGGSTMYETKYFELDIGQIGGS